MKRLVAQKNVLRMGDSRAMPVVENHRALHKEMEYAGWTTLPLWSTYFCSFLQSWMINSGKIC